jgi:hypothetical protein
LSPQRPENAKLTKENAVGNVIQIAIQIAEGVISRQLFADILRPLTEQRSPPDPAPA